MPKRPTLIVVDDEPALLRSIRDLLRRDYNVLTFEEADDALQVLTEVERVHVLITDQRMPGMSGIELLAKARTLRPETTRLLLTGMADPREMVGAINEANIFRFVHKPWDPDEFERIIKQAVEQHDLIEEKNRLVEELRETNARLSEADRLKNLFIEVASHELNTPVTIVLGLAELWRMSADPSGPPHERLWADQIYVAGKRLAATVERMFSLIKSDQFVQTLSVEEIDLEPLARRVIAELQPFLQARKQKIDVLIENDLGTIEVDTAKLGDVLANLLVNAIKFTPDGETIQFKARGEGTEGLTIEVIDRGLGINPDEFKHLFEPFFTGYDTLHHSSGDFQFGKRGIGLGLCVVKTFVELHGGTVEAESRLGEGSCFRIRLPRRQPRGAGKGSGKNNPVRSSEVDS